MKTKVARDQKAIGQGFNSEKNERVEAILGKHNKKRLAQLRLWWKENQIFVFSITLNISLPPLYSKLPIRF